MLAWLFARAEGRRFVLRIDDLDRVKVGAADRQIADLVALGLDFDGPPLLQSTRAAEHAAIIDRLVAQGATYECFCTRRDIAEAVSAPNAPLTPDGAYPGTCRELTDEQRARKRRTRPAALRIRADVTSATVADRVHGTATGFVDDLVLRRNDGLPAYNLTVVLDDAAQGVGQVVRGDDLLSSTPRQVWLAGRLDLPVPQYAHVPLVLGPGGKRLAKRDGAVTLADLARHGWSPSRVRTLLAASLHLAEPGEPVTMPTLLSRFDPATLPREPWRLDPATLTNGPDSGSPDSGSPDSESHD